MKKALFSIKTISNFIQLAFSNLDLNVQIEQDTRGERTCCSFSAEEESLNFRQRNSLDFCGSLWYMLLLQRRCADGTNQY